MQLRDYLVQTSSGSLKAIFFLSISNQTRAGSGGVPQPQTALWQSAGVGGYDGKRGKAV